MIELSFARKVIEIKQAERLAGGGIGHHIELEVIDPLGGRADPFELQTENALINVEHTVEHFLKREKGPQRFLIDGNISAC